MTTEEAFMIADNKVRLQQIEIEQLNHRLEKAKTVYFGLKAEIARLNRIIDDLSDTHHAEVIRQQDHEIRWLQMILSIRDHKQKTAASPDTAG
jgi:predicted RNase H-like nuclease (RuvC/YqgF family)